MVSTKNRITLAGLAGVLILCLFSNVSLSARIGQFLGGESAEVVETAAEIQEGIDTLIKENLETAKKDLDVSTQKAEDAIENTITWIEDKVNTKTEGAFLDFLEAAWKKRTDKAIQIELGKLFNAADSKKSAFSSSTKRSKVSKYKTDFKEFLAPPKTFADKLKEFETEHKENFTAPKKVDDAAKALKKLIDKEEAISGDDAKKLVATCKILVDGFESIPLKEWHTRVDKQEKERDKARKKVQEPLEAAGAKLTGTAKKDVEILITRLLAMMSEKELTDKLKKITKDMKSKNKFAKALEDFVAVAPLVKETEYSKVVGEFFNSWKAVETNVAKKDYLPTAKADAKKLLQNTLDAFDATKKSFTTIQQTQLNSVRKKVDAELEKVK